MPRLQHAETGVTINVSDEKAARLGREWQRATPARSARHTSEPPRSRRSRKIEPQDDDTE